MESLLLLLRFALAAVFATAAVGKVMDRRGSRQAMADFGVPDRFAGVTASLLPVVELVVAVGLLPAATARWAAIGALGLLLGFIAGIARALRHGGAPECHCFGQLYSAPAGPGALARNATLAAVAAVIVWRGPGPAVGDWLAGRTGADIALVATSAAALALGLLCLHLGRENRRLKRELQAAQRNRGLASGLPIGAPAPGFALAEVEGQTQSLETLRSRGLPLVLVFMDPGCGPCRALLPDLKRWQLTLSQALTLAVITRDGSDTTDPGAGQEGLANVLLQKRSEVSDAYRIKGTPSAVVVSPSGTIASSAAAGGPAIEALIRVTLQRDQPAGSRTALQPN